MTKEITETAATFLAGSFLAILSKVAIGAEWIDMVVFAFVGGIVAALGKEVGVLMISIIKTWKKQ